VVAIVLGIEVKSLLVGEGASPSDIEAIRAAATRGATSNRSSHEDALPGTGRTAGRDEGRGDSDHVGARGLGRDQRGGAAGSRGGAIARVIYIEPDIFDPEYQAESESSGATTAHSGHPVPAAPTPGEPGAVLAGSWRPALTSVMPVTSTHPVR